MATTDKQNNLIGRCEKLSLDFCAPTRGKLIISLLKGDDRLISVSMNHSDVKRWIEFLSDPPTHGMVALTDGRLEERSMYYYLDLTSDEGGSFHNKIGVSQRDKITRIVLQLHRDVVDVGFVNMTQIAIDALIGSLYVWLGNRVLSSITIASMFNTNSLQADNLVVNNISIPVYAD
jgi:hypothetical protein